MEDKRSYRSDQDKVIYIQDKIAIPKYYSKIWPGSVIESLDGKHRDKLRERLDFSGIDKIIFLPEGGFLHLSQRFRWGMRGELCPYDDFTLRYKRPFSKYKTEWQKIVLAVKKGLPLCEYYAYGHLNAEHTDFERLRIIHMPTFISSYQAKKLGNGKRPNGEPYKVIDSDGKVAYFLAWPMSRLKQCGCIFWELGSKE